MLYALMVLLAVGVSWYTQDIPAMPVKQELVKEEANITEIGRFMAYHSGRIYVAFVDKTILEMFWSQATGSDHHYNNKMFIHNHLPPGYCRLLLGNGQYQMVPVNHTPQPYQRYVLAEKSPLGIGDCTIRVFSIQ